MIDGKYEYFAFISYKEDDAEWAKWLQRKLEHYKLPTALRRENPELPERISPIYEYKSEAGGGRLKEVIWKGLTSSKYLIVICSPRATKSDWLNNGIRYFVESGQEENIIPFIVEGKPKADKPEEECFPSELLKLTGDRELRGINVNEMGRDAAAVKVVSQMFDVKFDSLWQRYEREQRKQRRKKIGSVLGGISVLAVVSFIFALIVSSKNDELEKVNWKMMENLTRVLSSKAMSLIEEGDSYLAGRLLLEVLPKDLSHPDRPYLIEAEAALRQSLLQSNAIFYFREGLMFNHVSFSPDDKKIIAAAPFQNSIHVLDAESGAEIEAIKEDEYIVFSHLFSPNKKLYLADSINFTGFCIVNLSNNKETKCFGRNVCNELSKSFSPNGEVVVSGHYDGTIRLWDANTGRCINALKGHKEEVNYVSFSPNGENLASASSDKTIKIWDLKTGICKQTLIGHLSEVNHVTFSLDGKMIASCSSDSTIRIWKSDTGSCIRILKGHRLISSAAFSRKCDRIVSVFLDNTIRLWDLKNDHVSKIVSHSKIKCIAYDSNGSNYAFASDTIIHVGKIGKCTNNQILKGHNDQINQIEFSPNGRMIASASNDKTIQVWDLRSGNIIHSLIGHANGVNSISFHPKMKQIASVSLDTIRIWDLKSEKCIAKYKIHTKNINYVSFSPDGNSIVTASDDKTICLLDVKTNNWHTRPHRKKVNTVSFSPKGEYIVSASDNIYIFDISRNMKSRIIFTGNEVSSAFFSPDGKKIVSAHSDGTICIWDFKTGKKIQTLSGHKDRAYYASFVSGGKEIISISADSTMRLWSFPNIQELINQTHERFKNRQLTPEELHKYYLEM